MRKRTKYPVCSQCDHVLNPNKEDDCEKYYLIDGEVYCKFCFQDWLHDLVDDDPDVLADALNIVKVYVENKYE